MTDRDAYYRRGLGGGRDTLSARRFWEAAEQGRLVVQRCGACGEYVFPPQDVCPYCWADQLGWREVDGEGRVYSFSTVHVDLRPAWSDRLPYVIAFVRLNEGVFLVTNLAECDPDAVEIGTPVEVVFGELPGEEGTFPQFTPSDAD